MNHLPFYLKRSIMQTKDQKAKLLKDAGVINEVIGSSLIGIFGILYRKVKFMVKEH